MLEAIAQRTECLFICLNKNVPSQTESKIPLLSHYPVFCHTFAIKHVLYSFCVVSDLFSSNFVWSFYRNKESIE